MTVGMWIIVIIALLVALFMLFVRWHGNWLARQTPAGSWTSTDGSASIKLVFEGGPSEGTYKQVVDSNGDTVREFGHWAANFNTFNMLILATDVPEHSRFGVDTRYHVSYVGPDSIRIEGPDRPNLVFSRAEDIAIGFDPDETSEPSGIHAGTPSLVVQAAVALVQ